MPIIQDPDIQTIEDVQERTHSDVVEFSITFDPEGSRELSYTTHEEIEHTIEVGPIQMQPPDRAPEPGWGSSVLSRADEEQNQTLKNYD